MKKEKVLGHRSTLLRMNTSRELTIKINPNDYQKIFLINGKKFIIVEISESDFMIKPNSCYMVINNKNNPLNIHYSENISYHKVLYNPYKYESSEKIHLKEELFKTRYMIRDGYIGTLPKWYSFKFSYPNYNLIFVRPEFGLSIQIHKYREEYWEILEGRPIVLNGNKVYYYVEKGTTFQNSINTYHSVINPNKKKDEFVLIRERWKGKFDEDDIERVFNPNNYK